MRIIPDKIIIDKVANACIDVNCSLSKEVYDALKYCLTKEDNIYAKETLNVILKNIEIAKKEKLPLCQDTGSCIVFVQIGEDVKIKSNLIDVINAGIRKGYEKGYLRKSIVDVLTRRNTNDNTPAIIYTEIVKGNKLKIDLLIKGAGSENTSQTAMLKPADGIEGVEKFVIDTVKTAGSNPCPPIFVGIGIGATQCYCSILAKKALLRKINQRHKNKQIANLEISLKDKINNLGIGAGGFGGNITCIDLAIETFPCHTASLPVCVNICCHAKRHKRIII